MTTTTADATAIPCACGGTIRPCACGAWHCPGWQHTGAIINHSHWCLRGARQAAPAE